MEYHKRLFFLINIANSTILLSTIQETQMCLMRDPEQTVKGSDGGGGCVKKKKVDRLDLITSP